MFPSSSMQVDTRQSEIQDSLPCPREVTTRVRRIRAGSTSVNILQRKLVIKICVGWVSFSFGATAGEILVPEIAVCRKRETLEGLFIAWEVHKINSGVAR